MKRSKAGFTEMELMVAVQTIVFLVVFLGGLIASVASIVKLAHCNFEAPYKKEVITAIGIMPPLGLVTIWINPDDEPTYGFNRVPGVVELNSVPDVED